MPTTPACQSSPATTSAPAWSWGAHSASASCRMRCSVSRRSWLRPSSSRAISAARSGSSVSISSSAASARSSRPAALMRGPSRKPADWASTSPGSRSATAMQRPQARLAGAGHGVHALARDPPVLAPQRHHVADRGQAGQVQVLLGQGGVHARRGVERARELEHHARGAQLARGALEAVRPQRRVHHRAVGQLGARAVVVGHQHVHAQLAGPRHLGHRRDAAVDGDEQRGAVARDPLDRLDAQAVALGAAGQLPGRVGAQRAQRPDHHGRGADAVHVVVAEHQDPRAGLDVAQHQLAGRRPPPAGRRVRCGCRRPGTPAPPPGSPYPRRTRMAAAAGPSPSASWSAAAAAPS